MWDDAKKGIENQLQQLCTFLIKYKGGKILEAFQRRDFHTVALLYNGKEYQAMAKKYNRVPYNLSLSIEYDRSVNIFMFMD